MSAGAINNVRKPLETSGRRHANGVVGWLIGNADAESYGIQRQLLCHSLTNKKTLVVGILFSIAMAFTAAAISGRIWAYAWLLAEILFGGIRWGALNSFERAEARGEVGDAVAPIVAGLVWVTVLSAAYYLCVASGELVL